MTSLAGSALEVPVAGHLIICRCRNGELRAELSVTEGTGKHSHTEASPTRPCPWSREEAPGSGLAGSPATSGRTRVDVATTNTGRRGPVAPPPAILRRSYGSLCVLGVPRSVPRMSLPCGAAMPLLPELDAAAGAWKLACWAQAGGSALDSTPARPAHPYGPEVPGDRVTGTHLTFLHATGGPLF